MVLRLPEDVIAQLNEYRGDDRTYDCVVPFSGGKDSSALLYTLAEETGLRILAFTLDYWFISQGAFENIKTVLKSAGVDHLMIRPSWRLVQNMYQKALYETGEICVVCEALLAGSIYRIAIEKQIPAVVWALVEGQFRTPPSWVIKVDRGHLGKVYNRRIRPLSRICGEDSPEFKHFERVYGFAEYLCVGEEVGLPDDVFPYLCIKYDSDEVERAANGIGWKRPSDTVGISSNCLACDLHNYLKKRRHSRDELLKGVVELVGKGLVSYERAMQVLDREEDATMAQNRLRDMGVTVSLEEYSRTVRHVEKRLR